MNIETLIDKIIPPMNMEIRNGYNNIPYLANLTTEEKNKIEYILINKLSGQNDEQIDPMIIETFTYLKSEKAIPILKEKLENCSSDSMRITLATAIFEISQDNNMLPIAFKSFKNIGNKTNPYYIFDLTNAFRQLIKFNDPEINRLIERYTTHRKMLVRYNANDVIRGLPVEPKLSFTRRLQKLFLSLFYR